MISAITPVYKESFTLLKHSVEHLLSFKNISEIIIVTTKSDPMAADVSRLTDLFVANPRVITSVADKPGRARQMNQGAKLAAAENLLFIHADTTLPAAADELIVSRLKHQSGQI